MRKFWFGVSLAVVFMFAAASSYIFFVLFGGAPELDKAYQPASALGEDGDLVPRITAETTVTVKERYACGYLAERTERAGGEFVDMSFDQLSREGWSVARIGEDRVELSREYAEICPIEQDMRLIKQTERGLAVYCGNREHTGDLLLEMPVKFDELPPELTATLASGGYQMDSPAELDELLESIDELIPVE